MEDLLSLKRMLAWSWLLLAVLGGAAWLFGSWSLAWGVLAGGIISIVSFSVSLRDVTAFFDGLGCESDQPGGATRGTRSKHVLFVKFWLRLLAIGLVLFVLIRFGGVNVFGLILGLTTVVLTITFSALRTVWGLYFSRR